jgi:hypothetical protein
MKKLALLLVIASIFGASPLMAEGFINGNELLDHCVQAQDKEKLSSHDTGHCFGFISGVTDLYDILISEMIVKPAYCPPPNVSLIQMVNIVVKYLEAHPENLHYSGSSLAIRAYVEAFPCTQSQSVK